MKRRTAWKFSTNDGLETHYGDCPRWVASVRSARPDLMATRVVRLAKQPWPCAACELGLRH